MDIKIVIVHTGYHILLDAALMKQEYPQEVVEGNNTTIYRRNYRRNASLSPKNIHVAGRLCDTYDVFPFSGVSNLDHARIGNYISFYNVGEYSVVFNMPFYCQTKPPIVMNTNSFSIS